MVGNKITFPILELTDWVFDGEKVLESESHWKGPYHIKEKDFKKHYQRLIIDIDGKILKVTLNKVLEKKPALLSFIFPPTLIVEFNLELTNKIMTLNDAKQKILSRSSENFHITHNKLITEDDYNKKITAAKTFAELFEIAAIVGEE